MAEINNFEEKMNILLNSPIITKKIPEIQPSPFILDSNKSLSDEYLLEKNIDNKKNNISFRNNSNSTDEEEEYKPEVRKLCIFEMLKKVSKEKMHLRKLQ